MTDALNYVDSCNAAAKDRLDNNETSEVLRMESPELSKDDGNRSKAKQTDNETLDEGFISLKEANQSALFFMFGDQFDNPSRQPQSAASGSRKRYSLVDYSRTRTVAMSELAKKTGSKIGSNVSKITARRRLEIQAELMNQQLQMEIEKRVRDLKLETKRRKIELERQQIEMEKILQ